MSKIGSNLFDEVLIGDAKAKYPNVTNFSDETWGMYLLFVYASNPKKYCNGENCKLSEDEKNNTGLLTSLKNFISSMIDLRNTNKSVLTNFCVKFDVSGSNIYEKLKSFDCTSNPTLIALNDTSSNDTLSNDTSSNNNEDFFSKYGLLIGIISGIFVFIIICIIVIVYSQSASKSKRRR